MPWGSAASVGATLASGGTMESIDKGREDALWRSLVADEELPRYWSESVWSHATGEPSGRCSSRRWPEAELSNELRLAELWDLCDIGCLCMDEFFELSALLSEVPVLPGSLCVDCDML